MTAELSSGEWGTDGTATVTTCINIPSNTSTPYECRRIVNGAKAGSFAIYNVDNIGADVPASPICILTWTVAKVNDKYEVTWIDFDVCEA